MILNTLFALEQWKCPQISSEDLQTLSIQDRKQSVVCYENAISIIQNLIDKKWSTCGFRYKENYFSQ